ncbi:hypothetical protein [Pseudonocardia sp. NPDC046786]|uniref:hypothetical protein n=1 Tax=Pseudonocardia sp. NPDC046786 TaxID=3155471 RepID=UPI00340681D2
MLRRLIPPPRTGPVLPHPGPAAPRTDPAAPRTDPAAPRTDPAVPRTDPAAPRSGPRPLPARAVALLLGALLLTACSGLTERTPETRTATAAGPGAPVLTGAGGTPAATGPGTTGTAGAGTAATPAATDTSGAGRSAGAGGSGGSAGQTGGPLLGVPDRPNTRGLGEPRPALIDLGGTGATGVVRDVSWQDWGGPHATGTGTASYAAPGAPLSAATPQPTTLVASDLGDCGGRTAYRVLTWYFPQYGEVPGARPPLDVCGR